MFAASLEWSFPVYFFGFGSLFLVFPSHLFAAIGVRGAVLLLSFQALELFVYWLGVENLEGWCYL